MVPYLYAELKEQNTGLEYARGFALDDAVEPQQHLLRSGLVPALDLEQQWLGPIKRSGFGILRDAPTLAIQLG